MLFSKICKNVCSITKKSLSFQKFAKKSLSAQKFAKNCTLANLRQDICPLFKFMTCIFQKITYFSEVFIIFFRRFCYIFPEVFVYYIFPEVFAYYKSGINSPFLLWCIIEQTVTNCLMR